MGEQLSPDQFDQKAPPHHDYVQLPSGVVLQELPAIYLTERDWYARRSSSPLDSGKNKSITGLALVNDQRPIFDYFPYKKHDYVGGRGSKNSKNVIT